MALLFAGVAVVPFFSLSQQPVNWQRFANAYGVSAEERAALIAVYNSTNGAGWTDRTNWRNAGDTDFNDPGTECLWFGVICTGSTVTTLDLKSNELDGTIPADLGNLSNLRTLNLYSNSLSGNIPPELGNLASLQVLYLRGNQLSGSIPPELGGLSVLQYLVLYDNQLTGGVPPVLGSLPDLVDLDLDSNYLTGSIPPELGNLSDLKYLYLASNSLSGNIPIELGSLSNLKVLSLSSNQLTGSIPSELGSLSNLVRMSLSSNQLTGNIPAEITDLTNLSDGWGTDLRWNALHSTDPTVVAFLNQKQNGGDWQSTQTIAPSNVAASLPTSSSVVLDWIPILYTADDGAYAVFPSPRPASDTIFTDGFESNDTKWWGLGNPWITTIDKTDTSVLVDGLDPGTPYDFIIRTITEPHVNNQNQVVSETSATVSETTTAR